mgnify:CR=1 FL=1
MLEKYSHIIWDWNGTILNDLELFVEITNQQLSEAKLPILTLEEYRESFSHPVDEFYQRLGFDLTRQPFGGIGADFSRRYADLRHGVGIQADAKQVLDEVLSRGKTQSVLSAHEQGMLDYMIRHHGLADHFSEVCGLSDFQASSKIQLGLNWLAARSHKRESLVIIGDTDHDYEVAKALGIDCILVSHGLQSHVRLKRLGVSVIEGLGELL